MSDSPVVQAVAAELLAAWDGVATLPALPSRRHGLSLADAFAVGERLRAARVARGERVVGWKIGFTNRTIWQRYGVHAPIWAPVYDSTTALLEGAEATLPLAGLSQPRLEPEIVFGLKAAPRAGMTLAELQACIEWVAHGFEVVHTHCEGWRFEAPDCLADFALHGRLRVGPRVAVDAGWSTLAEELAALRVQLWRDGVCVDEGTGANVLDGPLHALHTWVQAMAEHTPHWQPQAGHIVTTGTLTDAHALLPGQRWHTVLDAPAGRAQALAPLALRTTA